MAINKIFPTSPDKYIKVLGKNKAQAALARMAHLNPLIDQINTNTTAIASLAAAVAALGDLEYNNVIFVDSAFGNDTTGDTEVFGKPYQTIAAAVTAAASGDLIWVRPGTYPVSTNILKAGVHFYCDKGVTITSTSILFNGDTTARGTTLTAPVYFLGHAVINDTDLGGEGFAIIRTNPSAALYVEADAITVSNISNGMVIRDGFMGLHVRGNYTAAGRPFNVRDTGNIDAIIEGVVTTTSSSNFNAIFYSSGQAWTNGRANIKAKTFVMSNPAASQAYIEVTGATNCVLRVEVEYLTDATASTFRAVNIGANTTLSGTILFHEVSLGTRPLFGQTGAGNNLTFMVDRGSFAGASVTAGRVRIADSYVTPTATISSTGTGILSTRNSTIDCSATVGVSPITTGAGAAYNPTGTILVANGATATINNAAGSVYSAGSAGNTAAAAAITAGVFTVDAGFVI